MEVIVYSVSKNSQDATVMCGLPEGGLVPVLVQVLEGDCEKINALEPMRGVLQGTLRWSGRQFHGECLKLHEA